MINKLFNTVTAFSVLLFIGTISFSVLYPVERKEPAVKEEVVAESPVNDSLMEGLTAEEDDGKYRAMINLTLPEGNSPEDTEIEEDPMDRMITIKIKNAGAEYFETNPLSGRADHIKDIRYKTKDGNGEIKVYLDGIYAYEDTYENGVLELGFLKPNEKYEHVIVIDAGHGGKDGGTAENGAVEKEIDLSIALKLKDIFDLNPDESIKVYYTRLTDETVSVKKRTDFANDTGADIFLSIHNNSLNGEENAYVNGTQVMCYTNDGRNDSEAFAKILMKNITGRLESKDMGIISGNNIYVIKNTKMTAALCEIGFMSNLEEVQKLQDEDYQLSAAEALYESIKEQLKSN